MTYWTRLKFWMHQFIVSNVSFIVFPDWFHGSSAMWCLVLWKNKHEWCHLLKAGNRVYKFAGLMMRARAFLYQLMRVSKWVYAGKKELLFIDCNTDIFKTRTKFGSDSNLPLYTSSFSSFVASCFNEIIIKYTFFKGQLLMLCFDYCSPLFF